MAESSAFKQLHEGVQRWIWKKGWNKLHKIQEESIEAILNHVGDLIISASTASGKTEAAFLPTCSLLAKEPVHGVGLLYISPLKALINDQLRRLQGLCEILNLPLTPWHGDVLRSVKQRQKKKPAGILLITPESLESLLLNQASWSRVAFRHLGHIIIDEFHAFIGTERGCQLQSLMHRLEFLVERKIPRIALSATLGNLEKVADHLRPIQKFPFKIIQSESSHADLKLQLRGYLDPLNGDCSKPSSFDEITRDLYAILRGDSHLVFANSRSRTEAIAARMSSYCERDGFPNEFFPHHGNLSKDIRETLESRFQKEKLPTTAICTMTLELGIDIGSVDSIAQVTAPHSVASLRQRLGRSGRREEAAVLRMFISETQLNDKSHLIDRLRLETFQCIAMINLLLKKWYEPPVDNQYHLSTLVQQSLSVIGQYGGVRASQLWSLLCDTGPFHLVDQNLYAEFLRELGKKGLILQTQDGQIVLGPQGEKLVGHYTFYTAFNTPEEYRLEYEGRALGTLPIDRPLMVGQFLIFAGKKWQILNIDGEKKLVILKKAPGGSPPNFGGVGQGIHDRVRQEMFRVYQQETAPIYLDERARLLFKEGLETFQSMKLDQKNIISIGNSVHLLPWLGDQVANTITVLLRRVGLLADSFGGVIGISHSSAESFYEAVKEILKSPKPTPAELASDIEDTIVEKHDMILSKEMRDLNYGMRCFNVEGAWNWLESTL